MNSAFRVRSILWPYAGSNSDALPAYELAHIGTQKEWAMSEFFRSGAIVMMGLVVMGAGIAVVFYG